MANKTNGEEILKGIYPLVSSKLSKNVNKFKKAISDSFNRRALSLHDTCPCDRLTFGLEDMTEMYRALQITENDIRKPLSNTYYYSQSNFNPAAAKDEFTVMILTAVRYFHINKKEKEAEVTAMYLAFSGKFYPSIHYGSFPKFPPSEYRHVMEFVVNNRLNDRFDLKSQGSVFKAVQSICKTWLATYEDKIKRFEDEDVVYLIQQLHDRIKSFMKNIASIYYEVYARRDQYLVYDSDNMSDDNFRIADNDSLRIERIVENTMNYINANSINYRLCKMSSDTNVRTDEIKSIIETILNDPNNIPMAKELCRCIVTEYFLNSKTKDIHDLNFISFSITPKPNSKSTNVTRQKEIVEEWLNENSPAYRRRRSRLATKSSYHKSVITYFTLTIAESNK